MKEPQKPVGAIFDAAIELPPERRAACVQEACAGDDALRQRVEALLRAHESAGTFMDSLAVAPRGETPVVKPAEQPGDRIGRYKLLQQIGEGGCGIVYMAEQEEPVRRKVALKVIKLGMDTKQVIARFEAERQTLAMMDHPNIAKVLDAGATDTGRPYFVMELVRGIKITDYCDQNNLSTQERLDLFMQICRAIQHAHQKGIIHRDIKPSNILVTQNDGVPLPKVIDFGIAKATQGRLTDRTLFTAFEQFIGTPAYMSPEQAQMSAQDIDTRSDIYSLGVLLYELLTGETPFDAKALLQAGLDEIRRTIREKEPARPSTRLSTMLEGELTITAKHRHTDAPKLIHLLRGDLDWIVMKALEKDRARRYETANGLALDIQRHLDNEPVVARPPSTGYRFQKMVRRNKLVFAAAAAIATVLVVGVVVSTLEAVRATRAERDQSRLRQQAESARNEEARQRTKAEVNEKRAVSEAAKSQQVSQFLEDMLAGVGPSVALGRDATMLREILDKTAARIGNELTNQPEVEMELRGTLANIYHELGLYQQMEEAARQGLPLARSQPGEKDEDVAFFLSKLGDALRHLGTLDESEKLTREALALQRKLLGNERLSNKQKGYAADSLEVLGHILKERGKLAEAETAHREALALRKRLFGNEDSMVATSLGNLANVLEDQGKPAEAEKMRREELAIEMKLFGDEHPAIAHSLHDLAHGLLDQGKLAEAETMFRQALTMRRKLLGNEHPDVAYSLDGLADLLRDQGKLAEAETMFREALAIRRKRLGDEHPGTAHLLDDLASVLRDQGKLAEAETTFREALAIRRKLLSNDPPKVAASLRGSLHDLARLLRDQGKLAEAETLQREALVSLRELAPDDPGLAAGIAELTTTLLGEKKFAEAESLASECLTIREKKLPDDWRSFNTRSLLGGALLGQKNYAAAEPLLLSGYEGMKQREDKIPLEGKPRLKEALQRLAQLYEATSRPEQAAEWKQKLELLSGAEAETKTAATPKP